MPRFSTRRETPLSGSMTAILVHLTPLALSTALLSFGHDIYIVIMVIAVNHLFERNTVDLIFSFSEAFSFSLVIPVVYICP